MADFISCPACAYYAAHEGTLCPAHEFPASELATPRSPGWLRRIVRRIRAALAAGKEET